MRNLRWSVAGAVALAMGMGCDDAERPPLSVGSVGGQVAWLEASEAPVELLALTADGALGALVAQGAADNAGRFHLPGLRLDDGDYALRVTVGDRALTAPVLDYVRYSDRSVTVSPLTTLVVRSAQVRDGGPERFAAALADLRRHIGLDPVTTAVGQIGSDLADDATRHGILLDALAEVAARRAPPGSVSLPALFDALVVDAAAGGLDGLGPDGPVSLGGGTLGAQALQGEWADAVLELVTDGAWQVVGEAAARDLVARLRCSGSPLFPMCTPVDPDADSTPPVIEAIDPAEGTPLSGLTVFTVQANDPDGDLERLEFVRLEGSDVAETYPGLEGRPNVFQVDTRLLRGQDTLRVRVTAHNAAGLSSQRDFTYPLENIGRGVLAGWVTKGPARNALIKAYGFDGLAQVPLGEARTDAEGRFEIEVAEYSGPVLVEAASDPAAEPRTIFEDEVGGETGWPADRTLTTLHPSFDALAENPPVSVTPFGDLAATLARRQAAENQGSLVEAHEQAAEAVGAWLGLDAPVVSLLHGRPAGFDQAAAGFEDPERIAMALGCFSEQAATLSARAFPEGADTVNALDLVALYRLDAEADGRVDGLAGAAPATILVGATAVALPSDSLRADLPGACARWAGNARNQMAVEPEALVAWRQGLASQEDARLFDPTVPPRPVDDTPPGVEPGWAALDDGGVSAELREQLAETPRSRLPAARGSVRFQLQVTDASGVAEAVVSLRGMQDFEFEDVQIVESVGDIFSFGWSGILDTDLLPEGEHALLVDMTDPLGNTDQAVLRFRVDRTPPTAAMVTQIPASADGQEWHTQGREPATVQVSIAEEGVSTLEMRLAGEIIHQDTYEGEAVFEVPIPAQDREGRLVLSLRLTAPLDAPVVLDRTLVVDRTPPALNALPTRYRDEAGLNADRDLESVPELALTSEGGPLRHWQTEWSEGSDNPARLALLTTDSAGAAAGSSAAEIAIVLHHCLGSPQQCEHGEGSRDLAGGSERSITFSGGPDGWLDFDPADPPPPTTLTLSVNARDLAGNLTRLDIPYDFEVLPPPVFVELDSTALAFANDSIERLLAGQRVELSTFRVVNPHPVMTQVSIDLGDRSSVTLRAIIASPNYRIVENVIGLARCQEVKRDQQFGQLVAVDNCRSVVADIDCSVAQECMPLAAAYDGWSSPLRLELENGEQALQLPLPPDSIQAVRLFASVAEPIENSVYAGARGYVAPIGDAITQGRTQDPFGEELLVTVRADFEHRLMSLALSNLGLNSLSQHLAGEEYERVPPSEDVTVSR